MGFLCQLRDVVAYSDRFSNRYCFSCIKCFRPHSLLDFTTDITMKRKKTRIHARQIVVNNIDANIIVKQQQLISEYERFTEHLMLMLHGDPDRQAIMFSDELLYAHCIMKKLREMLECLHIIQKKDGK